MVVSDKYCPSLKAIKPQLFWTIAIWSSNRKNISKVKKIKSFIYRTWQQHISEDSSRCKRCSFRPADFGDVIMFCQSVQVSIKILGDKRCMVRGRLEKVNSSIFNGLWNCYKTRPSLGSWVSKQIYRTIPRNNSGDEWKLGCWKWCRWHLPHKANRALLQWELPVPSNFNITVHWSSQPC